MTVNQLLGLPANQSFSLEATEAISLQTDPIARCRDRGQELLPFTSWTFHTVVLLERTMSASGPLHASPPAAPRGGADHGVSLASEPVEELIKGWDCRLKWEVVSARRRRHNYSS